MTLICELFGIFGNCNSNNAHWLLWIILNDRLDRGRVPRKYLTMRHGRPCAIPVRTILVHFFNHSEWSHITDVSTNDGGNGAAAKKL
jgi:hypothetical protein